MTGPAATQTAVRWLHVAAGVMWCAVIMGSQSIRPVVAGRYSSSLAALIVVSAAFTVLLIRRAWRTPAMVDREHAWPALMFAVALAAWTLSLLISEPGDPALIQHLAVGQLFGSAIPIGVGFEFFAQITAAGAVALLLARRTAVLAQAGRRTAAGWHVAAMAVLVLLVAGEGAARAVNVISPHIQGAPTRSAALWTSRYVSLNRDGFRDTDWRAAASKQLRIVALGDSFTFGYGINRAEDRFTEVAERSLATGGWPIRVFNASRPDAHTRDEIDILDTATQLGAQLVVVAYVFNDIDEAAPPPPDPIFGRGGRFHQRDLARMVLSTSHLANEFILRLRAVALNGRGDHYLEAYRDGATLNAHLDTLAALAQKARAAHAEFRLVPFDIEPRRSAEYLARDVAFLSACESRGISTWNLLHTFDGAAYDDLIVNKWDHHPNVLAHRSFGLALADRIAHDSTLSQLRNP